MLLKIIEASAGSDGHPLAIDQTALLSFEIATHEEDERTIYWFLDAAGAVIKQSPLADHTDLPPHAQDGLSTVNGYRVAVLKSQSDASHTVIVTEPMNERNEAIRDVLLGVFLSFLLLGLIFFAVSYLAIKRSVRIIAHLSDNISEKNEHNLSGIDRRHSFAEIEPAIDTLDKLMERLEKALAAERAFATNAAHELRTPLAVALAQVQRLRADTPDPAGRVAIVKVEDALTFSARA